MHMNRTRVVQALTLSFVGYCLTIWGTTNAVELDRAQELYFCSQIDNGRDQKQVDISLIIKTTVVKD